MMVLGFISSEIVCAAWLMDCGERKARWSLRASQPWSASGYAWRSRSSATSASALSTVLSSDTKDAKMSTSVPAWAMAFGSGLNQRLRSDAGSKNCNLGLCFGVSV